MKETYVKKGKETFNIRGKDITVESEFRYDSLNNEKVSDNLLDEIAINKAFDKYYDKYDVIRPEEIKEIRSRLGLSTRSFAKFTGIGTASISRYENGQIPSEANNKLLKLIRDDSNYVGSLYSVNKEYLTAKEQESVYTTIKSSNTDNLINNFLEIEFKNEEPSIYSGFIKFNYEKYKNLVLYFSNNVKRLSKTKLNKLMFYSDFKYFEESTVSITGLNYIHNHYGPVPEDMELKLAFLNKQNLIEMRMFDNYQGEFINPLIEADMSSFSPEEIEVLNLVIEKFKYTNAKDISDISHKEIGYKETELQERISYEYADDLIAL